MIASSPSTPVLAAASGRVPSYDVPVIPTFPVDQLVAETSSSPSRLVKPVARPFSQSTTAFGASDSLIAPTVGQPSDRPVPTESECTTANPRGTQVLTSLFDTKVRSARCGIDGGDVRGGGASPSSWLTFQKYCDWVDAVPA